MTLICLIIINMSAKVRKIQLYILSLLFIALHGVEFVRETAIINPVPVMNVSCFILALLGAVLIVPNLKGHMRKIRINDIKSNPLLYIAVVLWLIFTVLASLSKSDDYWPILYFFLFGLFYIIKLNRDEKQTLIKAFFAGNIIGFILIQAFAYGFRPYDVARYCGPFPNPNITGLYYILMYTIVLFFIHYLVMNKAKLSYVFFNVILASYLLALVFITISRTALLAAVLITGLFFLMIVWRNWKWKFNKVVLAGLAYFVITVVIFFPTYATVRYLPGILHHPIWFGQEYSISKVHSFDPITSDKYVSLEELLSVSLGRSVQGFVSEKTSDMILEADLENVEPEKEELTVEPIEQQLVVKSPDAIVEHVEFAQGSILQRLDRFSSDRIRYSVVYLRNMNTDGHPKSQEVWLDDEQVYNTQNVFLQSAWDYGVPAGIVFFLLTICLCICHIKRYIHDKNNIYSILPILIMFIFYVFGQFEVVWEYGMIILWMFFFVQHPMFTESLEE